MDRHLDGAAEILYPLPTVWWPAVKEESAWRDHSAGRGASGGGGSAGVASVVARQDGNARPRDAAPEPRAVRSLTIRPAGARSEDRH